MYARRVDINRLHLAFGLMPRIRWRVVCGLQDVILDLLAKNMVQQRGFAHIRASDDRHITTARRYRVSLMG